MIKSMSNKANRIPSGLPVGSDDPPVVLQNMSSLSRQQVAVSQSNNGPATQQQEGPTSKMTGWGWGKWLSSGPKNDVPASSLPSPPQKESSNPPTKGQTHDPSPATESSRAISSSSAATSSPTEKKPQHPPSPRSQSPTNSPTALKKRLPGDNDKTSTNKKGTKSAKKGKKKGTKGNKEDGTAAPTTTTSSSAGSLSKPSSADHGAAAVATHTTKATNTFSLRTTATINPLNGLFRRGGFLNLGGSNTTTQPQPQQQHDQTTTTANITPSDSSDKNRRCQSSKHTTTTEYAWYEHALRQKQKAGEYVCADDQYALGLLDRQKDGDDLSEDELKELSSLADVYRQAQKDEAELEVLLEQKEAGLEDVDEDRLYQLELSLKGRMGETLTEEEEEMLHTLEQRCRDKKELDVLLGEKEGGLIVDEGRLYELKLLDRKYRGESDTMTDQEIRDVTLLERRREDARVDQREFEQMLHLKEQQGQQGGSDDKGLIDERRWYILNLIDRKRIGEDLTKDENHDLDEYYGRRDEEHLDSIELSMLLEKRNRGEPDADEERIYELELRKRVRQGLELTAEEDSDLILFQERREKESLDRILRERGLIGNGDLKGHIYENDEEELIDLLERKRKGETVVEERLYELELLERKRLNDDLTEDEEGDLAHFVELREREQVETQELVALLTKKNRGDKVDEKRLYFLELLNRKRLGKDMTLEETEDLRLFEEEELQSQLDDEELEEILNRKENGEEVDETRLYELQLFHRKRRGEDLTEDELMDLELFELQRTEGQDNLQSLKDAGVKEEDESISSYENMSMTPSEKVALDRVQEELKAQGLPITVAFSPGSRQRDKLQLSFISFGDDSYIQDLINQKENRAEARQEETLEEALELYHVALREKNLTESEQMFLAIFDQVLEEKNEESRKKDEEFDELVERELKLHELRKLEQAEKENKQQPEDLCMGDTSANIKSNERLNEPADAECNRGKEGRSESDHTELKREYNEKDEKCEFAPSTTVSQNDSENAPTVYECMGTEAHTQLQTVAASIRMTGGVEDDPSNSEAFPAAESPVTEDSEHRLDEEKSQVHTEEESPISVEEQIRVQTNDSLPETSASVEKLVVKQNPLQAEEETGIAEGPLHLDDELLLDGELLPIEPSLVQGEKSCSKEDKTSVELRFDGWNETHDPKKLFSESSVDTRPEKNLQPRGGIELLEEPKSEDDPDDMNRSESAMPAEETGKRNPWQNAHLKRQRIANAKLEKDGRRQVVQESLLNLDVHDELKETSSPVQDIQASSHDDDDHVQYDGCLLPDVSEPVMKTSNEEASQAEDGELNYQKNFALTDGEFEELNNLLDAQEMGEVIDEERLYELELLDRYSLGEKLTNEETGQLEVILNRRKRFQSYTEEYNTLHDRQESGEDIDKDRLYCLELIVRKRLGEPLTAEELVDLIEFEAVEEAKETTEISMEIADSVVGDEMPNHGGFWDGELFMMGMSDEPLALLPEVEEEELSQSESSGRQSVLATISVNESESQAEINEELNRLLDLREQGEEIDEQRLYELELFFRHANGEDLSSEELEDLGFFREQKIRLKSYTKEYNELLNLKELGQSVDEKRLYRLELVVRSRLGESLTDEELNALELFELQEEKATNSTPMDIPETAVEVSHLNSSVTDEVAYADEVAHADGNSGDEEVTSEDIWRSRADCLALSNGAIDDESDAEDLISQEVSLLSDHFPTKAGALDTPILLKEENQLSFSPTLTESTQEEPMRDEDDGPYLDLRHKFHMLTPATSVGFEETNLIDDRSQSSPSADLLRIRAHGKVHDDATTTLNNETVEMKMFDDSADCNVVSSNVTQVGIEEREGVVLYKESTGNFSESGWKGFDEKKDSFMPQNTWGDVGCPFMEEDGILIVDEDRGRLSVAMEVASEGAPVKVDHDSNFCSTLEIGLDPTSQSWLKPDGFAPTTLESRSKVCLGKGHPTGEVNVSCEKSLDPAEGDSDDSSATHQTNDDPTSKETETLEIDATTQSFLQTWEQSSAYHEPLDDSDGLTPSEFDELITLLDRNKDGDEIDEERLYELELLDRHGRGEILNADKLEDLEFVKERRQRLKQYQMEYEAMIERKRNGEDVDDIRFYSLGLIQKKCLGEALTDEELEDLESFETEKDEARLEAQSHVDVQNSQAFDESYSQNQSIRDVVDEARNLVREILASDVLDPTEEEENGPSSSAVYLGSNSPEKDEPLSIAGEKTKTQSIDGRNVELNDLLDRFDKGEKIDEEQLYELDLSERDRQGEHLNDQELQDLLLFRQKRDSMTVETKSAERAMQVKTERREESVKVADVIDAAYDQMARNVEEEQGSIATVDQTPAASTHTTTQVVNTTTRKAEQQISPDGKVSLSYKEKEEGSSNENNSNNIAKASRGWGIKLFGFGLKKRETSNMQPEKEAIAFEAEAKSLADVSKTSNEIKAAGSEMQNSRPSQMASHIPPKSSTDGEFEKDLPIDGGVSGVESDNESQGKAPVETESNPIKYNRILESHLGVVATKSDDLLDENATGDKSVSDAKSGSPFATKGDDGEELYEEELFNREQNGEELNDDELFELEMFLKRRDGDMLTPEELADLQFLREERCEAARDDSELEELRHKLTRGEEVDEERLYELELLARYRIGEDLNDEEMFELDAFNQIRSGETVSAEVLEELNMLRAERKQAKRDVKRIDSLKRTEVVDEVDRHYLFEIELKRKLSRTDNEQYALDLLGRIRAGNNLEKIELIELEKMRLLWENTGLDGSTRQRALPTDDVECTKELKHSVQTDDNLNSIEKFEVDLLEAVEQSDTLPEDNMNDLKRSRKELQDNEDELSELDHIRRMRDNNLDFDEDLLYELELFEKKRRQEALDEDEKHELDLFDKRRQGEQLNNTELDYLQMLKNRRVERRLDEEDLRDLRERKRNGEDVDDDLLYELELFEMMRNGVQLTDNQLFELHMFQLIRDGEGITDDQIAELEHLKRERLEAFLDEEDLKDLRDRKERGESIDRDLLYELELFQRNRNGETLSDQELFELDLFERRRDGEEIAEDDLDELELLKSNRMRLTQSAIDRNAKQEEIVVQSEDEDSVYRRDLLERQMKGHRLDKQEFHWLEILQKQKRTEELLEDELDELEIMRRHRKEKHVVVQNTKKLLQKEMNRKMKRELREQKRKEKLEGREQRRKEKAERPKVKKMRRKVKKEIDLPIDVVPEAQALSPVAPENEAPAGLVAPTTPEVEIVGMPPMASAMEKKDVPKKGIFGGVFGGNKKSKKEMELEEMKRRQEELIKEQMKALSLENELKELEKERELQEQLVQESIDKKIASADKESVSSWETDTAYESQESEDYDSSSMSSSSSSESDSSDISFGDFRADGIEQGGALAFNDAADTTDLVGSMVVVEEITDNEPTPLNSSLADAESMMSNRNKRHSVQSASNEVSEKSEEKISGDIQNLEDSHFPSHVQPFKFTDVDEGSAFSAGSRGGHGTENLSDEPNNKENRDRIRKTTRLPLSPKEKAKEVALSAHLKKQQKKKRTSKRNKTKHGDDLSIGTMQWAKLQKEPRSTENAETRLVNYDADVAAADRRQDRPWMASDGEDGKKLHRLLARNSVIQGQEAAPAEADKFFEKENREVFDRSIFNFNPSLGMNDDASNVSVSEAESVASAELAREGDVDNNGYESDLMLESQASSIGTLEEEAYLFRTPDYDNIERRLAEKFRTKEAEFDATWEATVADQNVAAQINQRLRERQRVKGSGKDEKKEDGNDIRNVPRLFLFEGEKMMSKKKKKKQKKTRRKDRKLQKKLDRTLSKEFRKAMKEVFDSDSEEEYDKTFGGEGGQGDGEVQKSFNLHRPGLLRRAQSVEKNLFSEDVSERSGNDNASGSVASDESDGFDGGYLQRLQERSLQQEVKQMLSESRRQLMNRTSTTSMQSSDDDDWSRGSDNSRTRRDSWEGINSYRYSKDGRRRRRKGRKPKRNRTGELVGDDVDPADVYSKEVEKQKEKKTFTIAGLRREMEDLKQTNNFMGSAKFSSQPNTSVSTSLAPPKPRPPKTPKKPASSASLNGPEVLLPQRPGLGARTTSFATTSSDQGLLTGAPKSFNGGLGSHPATIEEEDEEEEEAFLTAGNKSADFDGFHDSLGGRSKNSGAGFSNPFSTFNFFGTGASGFAASSDNDTPKSPSRSPFKTKRLPNFGNFGAGFGSSTGGGGIGSILPPSSKGAGGNGIFGSSGGLGNMSSNVIDSPPPLVPPVTFQEPLPVPDMVEDDGSKSRRGATSMRSFKNFFANIKVPGKGRNSSSSSKMGSGFMMDDDDDDDRDEGGIGLLG